MAESMRGDRERWVLQIRLERAGKVVGKAQRSVDTTGWTETEPDGVANVAKLLVRQIRRVENDEIEAD